MMAARTDKMLIGKKSPYTSKSFLNLRLLQSSPALYHEIRY